MTDKQWDSDAEQPRQSCVPQVRQIKENTAWGGELSMGGLEVGNQRRISGSAIDPAQLIRELQRWVAPAIEKASKAEPHAKEKAHQEAGHCPSWVGASECNAHCEEHQQWTADDAKKRQTSLQQAVHLVHNVGQSDAQAAVAKGEHFCDDNLVSLEPIWLLQHRFQIVFQRHGRERVHKAAHCGEWSAENARDN